MEQPQGGRALLDLIAGLLLTGGTFGVSYWSTGSASLSGGVTAVQILATMVVLDLREKGRKQQAEMLVHHSREELS